MHTANDQKISRITLLVSVLSIFILAIFFYFFNVRKPSSPEITTDFQAILEQETDAMRNQQLITEVGWANVLSTVDLNEYGIPQKLYYVQLITDTNNGELPLQFNVFAPSALIDESLMIRSILDYPWKKQVLIIKYTSNEEHFYFIPKQQLATTPPSVNEN